MNKEYHKKENQRVKLTKRIFRESLIELLQNKKLRQITVSELCNKAELNRSTFYKYYGNTYDVFAEIENEVMEQSKNCINQIDDTDINIHQIDNRDVNMIIQPLYRLLCYIDDNSETYQLLFNNSINSNLSVQLVDSTMTFLRKNSDLVHVNNKDYEEYIFSYIISGSIDIIKHWISSGSTETPEEIANLIYNVATKILLLNEIK